MVNVRVPTLTVIVHTLLLAVASRMSTTTVSPGFTGKFEIVIDGPGISSHHALYDAEPLEAMSWLVPAWMSVPSPAAQLVSRQPPPIPTHVADDSARPRC